MTRRLRRFGVVLALTLIAVGCAAGTAFRRGESAMRAGNLDDAVAYYRRAVQAAPDNPNYKIALERAMQAASRFHLDRARDFEQKDQLEAAVGEYRLASEYDPSNRQAAAKVVELDRKLRDRAEAARPRPPIEQMRERARVASAPPALLNFTTPLPAIRFNNASLKDVLNFIANATGINITYDREVTDRPVTIQLDGVTLEQALNQLMTMNQLSYKVVNEKSIFVFPDTPPKHTQYDEQVVRTFYISHADATELSQILSTIIRLPGINQPAIAANKTANTITVRGTTALVQILERIIEQNDKPRAEIIVDVEILEVDRERIKQYGINLSNYALGTIFSPEVSPSATTTVTPGTTTGAGTTTGQTGTTTTTTTTGRSTGPTQVLPPPPFNLNTISRGITTADFFLAVPTAVVNFLESDSQTKLIAKPQLRGAEGTKLTLNLGESIPIISTSYTPIATGGAGVNPLSSYQYKDVGINVDMTPRVTLEGDIILDLTLEDSSRGNDVAVAGVTVPSFGQRKVTTRLRLRDGESNLLAGLLRQDETRTTQGLPGVMRVPVLKQLLAGNLQDNKTTDIVMLLTPHIVRTHEIRDTDLAPIYIGSQQNLGVSGPPPLIAPPPCAEPPPGGAQPGAAAAGGRTYVAPGGAVVAPPPGSTPVPGTVLVPQPQTPAAPTIVTPGVQPEQPPPGQAQPGQAPPAAAAPAPTPPAATEVTATPGIGSAQVQITPPGTTFRVGQGPYTIPISITGATRLSTVTLTIIYDPAILRVRAVQEGSFMRSGGASTSFAQQVVGNRIDITITRGADTTGASGTGLLAAILFDTVAPGSATLTPSGTATGPGGAAMGLQFRPVTVTVQ